MKKILGLLMLLVTFASCSKDDEILFSISQEEVSFQVSGGEQTIIVTTDGDWSCNYDADWLLVREQQNKIRIIADENSNAGSRTAIIQVSCNGNIRSAIKVNQDGVSLEIPDETIVFTSMGEEKQIAVRCNSLDYKIECSEEWIEAQTGGDGLLVKVNRNYNMEDRTGNIKLIQGSVEKTLSIKQNACQWYDSFEMVDVEGGSFFIGAQKDNSSSQNYDNDAYQIETPVHKVTMSDFCIGLYEVTQAQWMAAMGSNPSIHQGDKLPVENVSWEQVQEFIALLNQASGLSYRLPTEAEWEFAARGGVKSEGNKYSGYSVLGACGWYYSNSESTTHEVGTKYPNELGIYDMSGNVREWCNDWFEYYSSTSVTNPQGPSYGNMKVNRGGSWTTPAVNCRNSYRHTDFPTEKAQDLGFRLVLSHE